MATLEVKIPIDRNSTTTLYDIIKEHMVDNKDKKIIIGKDASCALFQ